MNIFCSLLKKKKSVEEVLLKTTCRKMSGNLSSLSFPINHCCCHLFLSHGKLTFSCLHRPPVFGWKDENYNERIDNHKCMISQDIGYQIFATCKLFPSRISFRWQSIMFQWRRFICHLSSSWFSTGEFIKRRGSELTKEKQIRPTTGDAKVQKPQKRFQPQSFASKIEINCRRRIGIRRTLKP